MNVIIIELNRINDKAPLAATITVVNMKEYKGY